jgi:hypothetical protein
MIEVRGERHDLLARLLIQDLPPPRTLGIVSDEAE